MRYQKCKAHDDIGLTVRRSRCYRRWVGTSTCPSGPHEESKERGICYDRFSHLIVVLALTTVLAHAQRAANTPTEFDMYCSGVITTRQGPQRHVRHLGG